MGDARRERQAHCRPRRHRCPCWRPDYPSDTHVVMTVNVVHRCPGALESRSTGERPRLAEPLSAANRCLSVASFMAVVGLLVLGGGAWACVAQPLLTVTPRSSASVGATVTVNGYGVNGRAELRWNAIDGALLGTADGPVFSQSITVPNADPGLYALILVERAPDGGVGNIARASFELVAATAEGRADVPIAAHSDTARKTAKSMSNAVKASVVCALLGIGGLLGWLASSGRHSRIFGNADE